MKGENMYTKKCLKCSEQYESKGKQFGLCATCAGERIKELYNENRELLKYKNKCKQYEQSLDYGASVTIGGLKAEINRLKKKVIDKAYKEIEELEREV